jgi:hypothetical protein
VVTLTERAREALLGSIVAARRFDADAQLRVVRQGRGVRAVFAAEPDPADQLVELDGTTILVEAGIDGTLDAGEHNELTVVAP